MRFLQSPCWFLIVILPFAQAFIVKEWRYRRNNGFNAFVLSRNKTPSKVSFGPSWQRKRSAELFSSATDGNDSSSIEDRSKTLVKKEKTRLMRAYRIASYMYGSIGAVLSFTFVHVGSKRALVSSKLGGAAGFGIAAGLCFILQTATQHDRLNSDTYKRLNVGLLGFSVMSLAAIPGEAGFLPTFVPALLLSAIATVARLAGLTAAYRGWVQGLGGKASFRNLAQDFFQGTMESIRGLRVKQKGKLYRNFLLLVIFSGLSSFMDGIFKLRFAKDLVIGAFEISLQWSAVARLFMISTIIYSLKDAAERNRLQGTTFIQLNVMVGIWAFMVGIGQTLHPLGSAPKRGALMFAFGAPFLINALANAVKKSKSKLAVL
jgi:hypothetical protein